MAGPQRKYTYAELADAWQAEYPGEFDQFNRTDLVRAILAESPELEGILDPSTAGTEVVAPPHIPGAAMYRAPDPRIAPPERALRTPGITDMLAEAGLVAVPSVVGALKGGAIGTAVGGPGVGTAAGAALGMFAGGAGGETARELYQNWAETRDDGLSLPNIVLQGGINMIPFARATGGALKYVAPELAERIAGELPRLTRIAGSALEGSMASATSTATEALVRDRRLPELGELGMSAALGAPFGAAVGTGMEIRQAIRAGRVASDPAIAQRVDAAFRALRTGDRNAAAQQIYDIVTDVGNRNPAMGSELLQRLMTEANALAQDELRAFAGGFIRDFNARADTLTMDGQRAEIEQFLEGLKQRDAGEAILREVDGILTQIRESSAPVPAGRFPSEFSPENVRELLPIHGPEPDPGATPAEQTFGRAFEESLAGPPRAGEGPPAYRLEEDRPLYSARRNPPRPPEQQELGIKPGKPPLHPGPDVGTPPELVARGVDVLEGVRTGKVSRDEAVMMQLLQEELQEFRFERGTAEAVTNRPDISAEDTRYLEDRNVIFTPHAAGTPVQRMFEALGIKLTRSQIAAQIDNLLAGRARRPGKAALAAQKIARAMNEAWNPERGQWEWSRISDKTLKDVGLTTRQQFVSPYLPLRGIAERQADDLRERYGVRRAEDLADVPRAEDLAPDELAEARQLVRGASDEDLQRLYQELTGYDAQVHDLEAPEDFSGPWYEVGPGLIAEELVRRGRASYRQAGLEMEGPGTPGRSLVRPAPELQAPEERFGGYRPEPPKTLAEATARRERLAAEGKYGSPEYLDALRQENELADAGVRTEGTEVRTEEQPALLPEVRTEERPTPALMSEAELFRLTPETPKVPAPKKGPGLFGPEEGVAGDVRGTRASRARAVREFQISDEDFRDLQETVESAGDEEVAGLLLGDASGNIRRVVISDNRAANPTTQFEIGADVVDRALQFARSQGWEVLASFHSQPTGSAEPSKLDLRGSVADIPLVILGVRGGSLRDVKVWQPDVGPRGGRTRAPWLEGTLTRSQLAEAPSHVPKDVAKWMVERIPKFTGAPGDVPALETYLKAHKAEFSLDPWYIRAQQFLEEGNPRAAWVEVQAAGVAYQKAARQAAAATPATDAQRAALLERVDRALLAGPQDPVGALFALYDGRTTWVEGVGRVVVAPEIPPPLKGKGVTVGPGGILRPGQATVDLPIAQQSISMTVEAVDTILRDTSPHLILDDPTKASATRVMHQVAEQLLRRSPSQYAAERAWATAMRRQGMSEREINRQVAAHFTKSLSDAGRLIGALGLWTQRHQAEIRTIEGIRGASGEIEDVMIIGARGRRIGRLGDLAPADTFKDIVAPTRAWDRVMLLNQLTRPGPGTFSTLEAASRAFMLSQLSTAERNFTSVTARWGVEAFDEVMSALAATMLTRPGRALNHLKKAGDMLRYTPILRPDGWVMPWHARQAQFEQVFDSAAYLASLPVGKERQAGLALLQGIPEEQAHFLGSVMFGEPTPHGVSKYRILNWISQPKVQNTLTMFNRAQEFTARSGMYIVQLRDELRQRGIDPNLLQQLPPADLQALVGGADQMQRIIHAAAAASLDFTFSGATIKKGMGLDPQGRPIPAFNSFLIDLFNRFPFVRAGYPWPRFNFSAAPRFLWDHSGVNGVVEAMNQVLAEHAPTSLPGVLARAGLVGGGFAAGGPVGAVVGGAIALNKGVPISLAHGTRGRFALGREAASLQTSKIPEAEAGFRAAQADMGEALQRVQALDREFRVRTRLIARLERKGLPEAAASERPHLDALEKALAEEMHAFERAEDSMKGWRAQIDKLQETVTQATEVRAPQTYAALLGRAATGIGMLLPVAIMLRAEQADKDTAWHDLRYDIPGLGDTVIDTRPLSPFTQFLFFGDIINDLSANTDWIGVGEDLAAGMHMSEAIYGRYEGKYTARTLGVEAMNAFLSMSQAAGTTLAIIEELTSFGERGFDSERLGSRTVEALGNFLARFFIPFAQFKGLTALADPEEAHARITSTDQGMLAPLAQPLGNLPFVGAAVIPETYNQLSGQPLSTHLPWLRALLGITTRKWDRMSGEIRATGVPGPSVYIRATHDVGLDRLIGYHYSQAISQYADPLIFANEYYLSLDSPATRRDYLQSTVFPTLKKIALGQAILDVGWQRMREERETPEQRRRRLRTERLQGLAREENISFAEGGAPDEPEPDADVPEPDEPEAPAVDAPAGPPQGRLRGPDFAPGAFDRALAGPEYETA